MNTRSLALPNMLGWVAAVAGAFAVFATYWDEAWHTDVGRDTFWSAPHVLLYGSVAVAGIAVAVWGLCALMATRSLRGVLRHHPLTLAGAAGATVLAAAPIDAAWHTAYGRDAVLWSPPHMLAIFGSTALLLAVLTGLEPTQVALRTAVGVLLLANGVAVVFEYEAGVPQFSETLYLPVLLLAGLALAVLIRTHVPLKAPVATVVVGYAALRLVIALGLAVLDRSTPDLPIAVLGFAAFDLPLRSNLRRTAAAAGAVAALAWAASATGVASPGSGAVGLTAVPIIVVALALVAVGVRRGPKLLAAIAVLAAVGVATFVPARPAAAHDPGQGHPVAEIEMTARTDRAGDVALTLVVPREHCDDLAPIRVVARRAGTTNTGELRATGPCRFVGSVEASRHGRWFVYAELRHDGDTVEAWLPVFPEEVHEVSKTRTLYLPAGAGTGLTASQAVWGGVLYAAGLALLGFGFVATRAAGNLKAAGDWSTSLR